MESAAVGRAGSVLRTVLGSSVANTLSRRADQAGEAQNERGIGIVSFLTALVVAIIIFSVQFLIFLLLRNKLARIFKPKTYLVPERERTDPPPSSLIGLFKAVFFYPEREVIKKCGLDAYFFLRYLKTLLVIFVPICVIGLPIMIPLNYVGGRGQDVNVGENDSARNDTTQVVGLDTLAWGNVKNTNTNRYLGHLLMAIAVVIWVCVVVFFELRVYIKVRQDYLTSAEHRLRASATTVLVNNIPPKWLSEEALRGLFDVFPGGVRNVWLNRDLTELLDKISMRDKVHKMLESAETDLIKAAKKAHNKIRKAEEKKQRKEHKLGHMSKNERAARDAEEDAEAKRRANSEGGTNAGDRHDNRHSIHDGLDNNSTEAADGSGHARQWSKGFKGPLLTDPLARVGHGLLGAVGAVNKAGQNVDDTLETTNGFVGIDTAPASNSPGRPQNLRLPKATDEIEPPRASASESLNAHGTRDSVDSTTKALKSQPPRDPVGNTVRKLENIDDQFIKEETKFWQFWKPPTGGYASPVPQGGEAADYMTKVATGKKSGWQKFKSSLPFVGGQELSPLEYDIAYNPENQDQDQPGAEWEKYLKKKARPTHRLPAFGVSALPGIPFVTKKVDTIYWCREELARLNLEIDEDQKHPERYPLMSSAFIQFEHQVAAHMACQSTIHHIPRQMAPRMIETSPNDVIWDNMAMPWWQEWARAGLAIAFIAAMILLWAIPVAFTASLSQLDELVNDYEWLSFLEANDAIRTVATAVAGVLPAALLALLLFLVPLVLDFLGNFKGAKTGSQKSEFVQIFYFAFLFVQVFLIVSVASFFATSFDKLFSNFSEIQTVGDVLDILATNLPKAANYFFSYMILQALSTSSGTLLQIGTLIVWFIVARIMDSTARQKWSRNTKLSDVSWGKFFPIYTNFACIGLIYSVIAPLISIFAIITFGLLYMAHRYSMLYVTRFKHDTGGVLYPRALNQTFTGIYFMELCIAGLFYIVEDDHGRKVCSPHGTIMLVVLGCTVVYQVLLNRSFSPLFRYLPITVEDEAVLRDEAFQRAQNRRFGIAEETEDSEDDSQLASLRSEKSPRGDGRHGDIEMDELRDRKRRQNNKLRNPIKQVGAWAKGGGNQVRKMTFTDQQAIEYRKKQRRKDIEAQRAIGDALYGGMNDDVEDLTPEERDLLIRHAFKHAALRARRPTVWIPRDDIGVSDDEIRRTKAYSEHIWISNEGTALDSKVRVVYGKNPPDFSEVDVINL